MVPSPEFFFDTRCGWTGTGPQPQLAEAYIATPVPYCLPWSPVFREATRICFYLLNKFHLQRSRSAPFAHHKTTEPSRILHPCKYRILTGYRIRQPRGGRTRSPRDRTGEAGSTGEPRRGPHDTEVPLYEYEKIRNGNAGPAGGYSNSSRTPYAEASQ